MSMARYVDDPAPSKPFADPESPEPFRIPPGRELRRSRIERKTSVETALRKNPVSSPPSIPPSSISRSPNLPESLAAVDSKKPFLVERRVWSYQPSKLSSSFGPGDSDSNSPAPALSSRASSLDYPCLDVDQVYLDSSDDGSSEVDSPVSQAHSTLRKRQIKLPLGIHLAILSASKLQEAKSVVATKGAQLSKVVLCQNLLNYLIRNGTSGPHSSPHSVSGSLSESDDFDDFDAAFDDSDCDTDIHQPIALTRSDPHSRRSSGGASDDRDLTAVEPVDRPSSTPSPPPPPPPPPPYRKRHLSVTLKASSEFTPILPISQDPNSTVSYYIDAPDLPRSPLSPNQESPASTEGGLIHLQPTAASQSQIKIDIYPPRLSDLVPDTKGLFSVGLTRGQILKKFDDFKTKTKETFSKWDSLKKMRSGTLAADPLPDAGDEAFAADPTANGPSIPTPRGSLTPASAITPSKAFPGSLRVPVPSSSAIPAAPTVQPSPPTLNASPYPPPSPWPPTPMSSALVSPKSAPLLSPTVPPPSDSKNPPRVSFQPTSSQAQQRSLLPNPRRTSTGSLKAIFLRSASPEEPVAQLSSQSRVFGLPSKSPSAASSRPFSKKWTLLKPRVADSSV
ncbi:uncharacterized protein BJ171DRAFT_580305 [Polychytrium aggregatum]|uniref:uncharacterized protein n=1 Tax=Polychytrium aggregatum TaxID=110093 RepID=UPI0022FE90E1|nr:uncharacterized protein BJ171DRAFT_580305 [Polychytrium aggregatum]KAI9206230.1 hypothetical protein BJ171DRAFT_580305 [Polychytrium aggregatum]